MFRNLCCISASGGTLCQVEPLLPAPCSQSVLRILAVQGVKRQFNEAGKGMRGEQQGKREGETEMGENCVYGTRKQSPEVSSKKNKSRSETSTGF